MFWPPNPAREKMPQLNGGGGDDLGANDEMISFKDEGEQEEKISENSSAERDLADVKSSLVNESETNQNSSSDSEVSDKTPRISCPLVYLTLLCKARNFFPRVSVCMCVCTAAVINTKANRVAIVLCSPLPVSLLHEKAERRPPPRAETFRDKTRESLEEGESLFSLNEPVI